MNRDRDQGRSYHGSTVRGSASRGGGSLHSDTIHGQIASKFIRGSTTVRGGLKGKQPGIGLRKVNWDLCSLEPLRKDFYIEHPAVRNRY